VKKTGKLEFPNDDVAQQVVRHVLSGGRPEELTPSRGLPANAQRAAAAFAQVHFGGVDIRDVRQDSAKGPVHPLGDRKTRAFYGAWTGEASPSGHSPLHG
jgi:hypothetical protein